MNRLLFTFRAVLALGFLVGFYALAAAVALLLVYLPYAGLVYARRLNVRLTLFCLAAAFAIVRGLFFVPRPAFRPPGPEVREEDEPELFALIRDVATRMQTRMPAHVYIFADVNAFVTEVGGWMGFGATRVLGVGLGLLRVDDVSNLRATLAHEFGHYAAGHTRLGGLVYRTRAAIANLIESLGRSWLSKPFDAYGRLYLRVSQAVSRGQELEADRAGVALAGREAHIEGLRIESRAGAAFSAFVRSELAPILRAGLMPERLYDAFAEFFRKAPAAEIDAALEGMPAHPFDTHPSLAHRLAFAKELPDSHAARDTRPAASLLRDPERLERDVEPYLLNALGVGGALARVAWADVAIKCYGPRLSEDARALAGKLFPVLRAGPPYANVARALAAALDGDARRAEIARTLEPELAQVVAAEQEEATRAVLSRALGVLAGAALVERGGKWTTSIGEPLKVELDGRTLDPFAAARDAVKDRQGLERYRALVDASVASVQA